MYKFSHHVQEVFGLMHVKLNSAEFSVLNKLATTSAVNSAKKLCISLDIVGSSKIAKCRSDEEKCSSFGGALLIRSLDVYS